MLLLRVTLLLVAILSEFQFVSALGWSVTNREDAVAAKDMAPPLDTTRLANLPASDLIKNVQKTLATIQQQPTCLRLAAEALIHSCATLDGSVSLTPGRHGSGSEHVLDDSKTIYAARLAICELDAARATIPGACKAFLPTERPTEKTPRHRHLDQGSRDAAYDTSDEEALATLQPCLTALHGTGTGQSWTSYSNARQNAVVMCHAVRGERDRDEQIDLFKVLASLTGDISTAMYLTTKEFDTIKAAFREFSNGFMAMDAELRRHDAERMEDIRQAWDSWKSALQRDVDEVGKRAKSVQTELDTTVGAVTQSGSEVRATFEEVAVNLARLVSNHHHDMATLSDRQTDLGKKIAFADEYITQHLLQSLADTANNLGITNAMVLRNNEVLSEHDAALRSTASTIEGMQYLVIGLGAEMQEALNASRNLHERLGRMEIVANDASMKIEMLGLHLTSWLDFLSGGWVDLIAPACRACTFVLYASFFSSLVFCGMRYLADTSFLPSVAIAMATGLGLAFTSLRYYGPFDLIRDIKNLDQDGILLLLLAFAVGAAIVMFVKHLRRGHQSEPELDGCNIKGCCRKPTVHSPWIT